jgi:hypothetical protein
MSAQNTRLLEWLQSHNTITTLEATHELGIQRISERVRELEDEGYPIWHEAQVVVPNRYGQTCHVTRYHLLEERYAYG